jgi:hypothetical protein
VQCSEKNYYFLFSQGGMTSIDYDLNGNSREFVLKGLLSGTAFDILFGTVTCVN